MWEIWRSRSCQHLASLQSSRANRTVDDWQSPVESASPLGRIASGTVNFKDLSIRSEVLEAADEFSEHDDHHSEDSTNKGSILLRARNVPERTKYVIILVGLPGRGKTFLCNKLTNYLNWLGHSTRHFNVGSYRRRQKGNHEVQDAQFFDSNNPAGVEARQRALNAALDDLQSYLFSSEGQIAIFDATNTTGERRMQLIRAFHGRFQYLFIESICTDGKVLDGNYRLKMRYSADYQGVDEEEALRDFKARISKYEQVYEPIADRSLHYIKLIDMVTGRGHMDVNRISGYLPGKIVFFLMQVLKAGMPQQRRIWLTRHGESEYNVARRIGGNSDLTPRGEAYAGSLPDELMQRMSLLQQAPNGEQQAVPVSVWTSTLRRTIQTAKHLPFPKLRWKALDEIQAGSCDGLTYEQIKAQFPEEAKAREQDKLRYRYPAGESYLDVIQRLEPVIIEMEREKESIVLVAHQAVLRAVLGYFLAIPLEDIPKQAIDLHTVIELCPKPDGTVVPFTLHVPIPPAVAPAAADDGAIAAAAAAAAATAPPAPAPPAAAAAAAPPPLQVANGISPPPASSLPLPAALPIIRTRLEAAEAAAAAAEASAAGSPNASFHSRVHSLGAGLGGGGSGSVLLGCSPVEGGLSPPPPSSFVFGSVCSAGGAVDSPSKLTAAALVAADGRARLVRVPYGAMLGGGGSEGGAAPDAAYYGGGGVLAGPFGSAGGAAPPQQQQQQQ